MIFKLVNYTILGIAAFYAAEGLGVVEKGLYFPSLPRLEASAGDPMAWVGAAEWGFTQLGTFAQGHGGDFDTGSMGQLADNSFTNNAISSLSDRLSDIRGSTSARLLSAYGNR